MSGTVLWIVGEPGIGKTTLARVLIDRLTNSQERSSIEILRPKWTLFAESVAAAGHWRGDKFDGADTLPISDIKPAMEYWKEHLSSYLLTLLDGDKLSNAGAVAFVRPIAKRTLCVLLYDEETATKRRIQRGTTQNATWVKGRRTKAERFFFNQFGLGERGAIHALRPLSEQVDLVLEFLGTL